MTKGWRWTAARAGANRASAASLLAVALWACGGESSETAPAEGGGGGGAGGEAGCAIGEMPLPDGSCRPAGVSACGEGFEPDEAGGCVAVLPADPCSPGTMAVPGESSCRPVAPCGDGTWGDIPLEADSQFVDGSYGGADSDGSQARPWTSIQQGVDAAAAGAIVAVAEGSYAEDVLVTGKAVRLWGRCPARVEILGQGDNLGAVQIVFGAHGTEVRDLAVTGSSMGVVVSDAEDVLVERVWVHDVEWRGINAQTTNNATSVSVRDTLVESARDIGVFSYGSTVSLEQSVVRATRTTTDLEFGRGVASQAVPTRRATVTIRQSLIEQNHDIGVFASGTDLVVESTMVRETHSASQIWTGRGVGLQHDPSTDQRSIAVLRSSLIEGNRATGVYVAGSVATLEDTVVRDTVPTDGENGGGLRALPDGTTGLRSEVNLQSCVVERNTWVGVGAQDADLTVEGTIIRDTRAGLDWGGVGLSISNGVVEGGRSNGQVRYGVLERNGRIQLLVNGSDAAILGTVVRESVPAEHEIWGHGVQVQIDIATESPSVATIESCLVEDAYDLGVVIVGSDVVVSDTTVRRTQPRVLGGLFGDGLAVVSEFVPATVTVRDVRIEDNARAGLSAFGAHIILGATTMACNTIDLAGAAHFEFEFQLDDLGGNECGCETLGSCAVATAGLEPPSIGGEG